MYFMDQQALKNYVISACEINQVSLDDAQTARVLMHLSRTQLIAQRLIDYPFSDEDELVEIYKIVE